MSTTAQPSPDLDRHPRPASSSPSSSASATRWSSPGSSSSPSTGQANGSLVQVDDEVVGSAPASASRSPTPDGERAARVVPVAALRRGRRATTRGASSGSNYGPENADLDRRDRGPARRDREPRRRRRRPDPGRRGHRIRLRARPAHQPRRTPCCRSPRVADGARARRSGGARPRGVYDPGPRPRLPRRADGERAAAEHRAGASWTRSSAWQGARLRVLLGAAPGVGKTYAMLEEGRRLQRQGATWWSRSSETHGRAATSALLDGPRGRPAPHRRAPRRRARRDGPRRGARPQPAARPGRRARPHQRARLRAREALAGRRRAAATRAST